MPQRSIQSRRFSIAARMLRDSARRGLGVVSREASAQRIRRQARRAATRAKLAAAAVRNGFATLARVLTESRAVRGAWDGTRHGATRTRAPAKAPIARRPARPPFPPQLRLAPPRARPASRLGLAGTVVAQRLKSVAALRLSRRRVRQWAIGTGLSVVSALCLTVLALVIMTRATPSWWRSVPRDDPETIALGIDVENGVINRATRNRPAAPDSKAGEPWHSEPWTVAVTAEQVNAWLNVRLPKWLTNQKDDFHWPKDVSDVQVDLRPGGVTIGARLRSGSRQQVLSATIEPRLDDAGRLFIPARWVNVGRLPIPAGWVLDGKSAEQYIPPDIRQLPETESLLRAFAGAGAVRDDTVFSIGSGRLVRILEIAPGDGVLRITCRTEME